MFSKPLGFKVRKDSVGIKVFLMGFLVTPVYVFGV
jgi:uncharacterized membrane protein (DUF485 family)